MDCNEDENNDNAEINKPSYHTQSQHTFSTWTATIFQHRLPPYPCSICTQQGIPNAYHWKLQCPFNQHQLRQTPVTYDSSLATNTVSQSSENSVSSQQIPIIPLY
ncbi:uncharacterized protein TNCV_688491 [Trichonephila clavipes]|nr:uncharacterized protein TNCV_688491 [Trichonephila clavipes]